MAVCGHWPPRQFRTVNLARTWPVGAFIGGLAMAAIDALTVRDMASELRVGRSTVYRWLATGRGPRIFRLPNNEIRIHRADFIEWVGRLEIDRKGS
ncbi:helix-turn-helix transcriptional regulator [Actinomadura oligospora]|uniref:helix-turn-helix transcriptional regulator n=1 Tax=Actinomadura oligospora TaxID=111804 RepID=UPI003CCBA8EA